MNKPWIIWLVRVLSVRSVHISFPHWWVDSHFKNMSFHCCYYSSKSLPFVDDNFRVLFTFYNRLTAAGALSFSFFFHFSFIWHKWDIMVKLTDFHWTVFSVSKIQKRNQPAHFIYIKVQETGDCLAFYLLSTLWMLNGFPQPNHFHLINFTFFSPFLSLNIRF